MVNKINDKITRFNEYYSRIKKSAGTNKAVLGMTAYIVDGAFKHNTSLYFKYINRCVNEQLKDFSPSFDEKADKNKHFDFKNKMPIWVCWFQGYENMPELVKLCYKQLTLMADDSCEVVLITSENIYEYVDFPDEVISKVGNEYSLTNFSDLLRFKLLSEYGGLWIDATVFVSKPISSRLIKNGFFSQKNSMAKDKKYYASHHMWSSWLLADKAGKKLFTFASQAMEYYYQHYDGPIDYYLCDYLFLAAMKRYGDVKKEVYELANNNIGTFELVGILNNEYDPTRLKEILSNNQFNKLTYKEKNYRSLNGKSTNYATLLKQVAM